MSRNIRCCFLALVALLGVSETISAQDHCSARINSLGGEHVSGIIPDLYTDLGINPAYAYFADGFTINYGRRSVPGFRMPFPYLGGSGNGMSVGGGGTTNELTFHGMRLSGWRAALSAEWRIDSSERKTANMDLYISGEREDTDERWDNSDGNFWRVDLVAARPLGDNRVLGLRLKASGYYANQSSADLWSWTYYSNGSFIQPSSESLNHDASSALGRETSFDLETGIAGSSGAGSQSEVIARVSARRINYDRESYSLDIDKDYDSDNQVEGYSYDKAQWSDTRKGDVWTCGLWLRRTFPCGIRIFTGGSYSTADYDAGWHDILDALDWNLYSSREDLFSGEFTGVGSLRGGTFVLKGGKVFNLHKTIDLYVGMHGAFSRSRAEEDPIIHYVHEQDGGASVLSIDQPVTMRATVTSLDVFFPVSIEFKPSSYFSYFAGFTFYGGWNKHTVERPSPSYFYFNEQQADFAPAGVLRSAARFQTTIYPEGSIVDWHRDVATGYILTLGFSLHYGDRLFVDAFTGTDIIPSYWGSQYLDVKYSF